MKQRRKFDKQFKIDAVKLFESSEKTGKEIATDLGIPSDALYRWRREFNEKEKEAFTGQGNSRDEEMARMKKEIVELKMERDILKKAMVIFSQNEK